MSTAMPILGEQASRPTRELPYSFFKKDGTVRSRVGELKELWNFRTNKPGEREVRADDVFDSGIPKKEMKDLHTELTEFAQAKLLVMYCENATTLGYYREDGQDLTRMADLKDLMGRFHKGKSNHKPNHQDNQATKGGEPNKDQDHQKAEDKFDADGLYRVCYFMDKVLVRNIVDEFCENKNIVLFDDAKIKKKEHKGLGGDQGLSADASVAVSLTSETRMRKRSESSRGSWDGVVNNARKVFMSRLFEAQQKHLGWHLNKTKSTSDKKYSHEERLIKVGKDTVRYFIATPKKPLVEEVEKPGSVPGSVCGVRVDKLLDIIKAQGYSGDVQSLHIQIKECSPSKPPAVRHELPDHVSAYGSISRPTQSVVSGLTMLDGSGEEAEHVDVAGGDHNQDDLDGIGFNDLDDTPLENKEDPTATEGVTTTPDAKMPPPKAVPPIGVVNLWESPVDNIGNLNLATQPNNPLTLGGQSSMHPKKDLVAAFAQQEDYLDLTQDAQNSRKKQKSSHHENGHENGAQQAPNSKHVEGHGSIIAATGSKQAATKTTGSKQAARKTTKNKQTPKTKKTTARITPDKSATATTATQMGTTAGEKRKATGDLVADYDFEVRCPPCDHGSSASYKEMQASYFDKDYLSGKERAVRQCCSCKKLFGQQIKVTLQAPVMACCNAENSNHPCQHAYCKGCYTRDILSVAPRGKRGTRPNPKYCE